MNHFNRDDGRVFRKKVLNASAGTVRWRCAWCRETFRKMAQCEDHEKTCSHRSKRDATVPKCKSSSK